MANDSMAYIVIEDAMFVYRMISYDKATNTAYLTLYKNPNTFRANRPLTKIEVADWQ
jgi:hypothetical protein